MSNCSANHWRDVVAHHALQLLSTVPATADTSQHDLCQGYEHLLSKPLA
jgi:hypothetical protein